jgi:hypothetical protein
MKRYRRVPTLAEPVETLIALRYPNGRVHETTVDRQLTSGERFEMYGRTWTAEQAKKGTEPREEGRASYAVRAGRLRS